MKKLTSGYKTWEPKLKGFNTSIKIKKMNVLLIGSGGREHALAWKMSQSKHLDKLFISPGNAGTFSLGENIMLNLDSPYQIKEFIFQHNIEMVVVGPEQPLVNGLKDQFLDDSELKKIIFIGPNSTGAMLEGSKDFAKQFMQRYQIPTAAYQTFDEKNLHQAMDFVKTLQPPYVLKADGLAAGKGVLILDDLVEAEQALNDMIRNRRFGDASKKVVIEEYLNGIELSVFILTDGTSYKILPEAKDYKRIGENDTGLNTGGMGSISPVPFADETFMKKVEERIIQPTMKGIQKEKINYSGFIFFGLMKVGDDPFVIEYNVRMGDPEAESVLPRITSDLMEAFISIGENRLDKHAFTFDSRTVASVFTVSGGYPEEYEKGKIIEGLDQVQNSLLFHAGTQINDAGKTVTNGGRVIAVSSFGNSIADALALSYLNIDSISFEGMYFRKDLGHDLLNIN